MISAAVATALPPPEMLKWNKYTISLVPCKARHVVMALKEFVVTGEAGMTQEPQDGFPWQPGCLL